MRFLGLLQCWISGVTPDWERQQAFSDDCGHLPCNFRRKFERKISTKMQQQSQSHGQNELEALRQEAEVLKAQIRVSIWCVTSITTLRVGWNIEGPMTMCDRLRKCGINVVYSCKPPIWARGRSIHAIYDGFWPIRCILRLFNAVLLLVIGKFAHRLVGVAISCLCRMPRDLCPYIQYCRPEYVNFKLYFVTNGKIMALCTALCSFYAKRRVRFEAIFYCYTCVYCCTGAVCNISEYCIHYV